MRRLALLPFIAALALTTPAHAQTPYPLPEKDFQTGANISFVPACLSDGSNAGQCVSADAFDQAWGTDTTSPGFQSAPIATWGFQSGWFMDGQTPKGKHFTDITVLALTLDSPDHAAQVADDYILSVHSLTGATLSPTALPAGVRAVSHFSTKKYGYRFEAAVSGNVAIEAACLWRTRSGDGPTVKRDEAQLVADALAANP